MLQQNRKEFSDIAPRLQSALQAVVDDVVARLGCIGAIATTLENDHGLYVRAAAFQVSAGQAQRFLADSGLNVTGSSAILYLDEKKHRNNLGVSAVKGVNGRAQTIEQPYLISDQLFDLLRPLTDAATAARLQEELGISQVVTIPFIVENEVVGSLMAAAPGLFDERDIDFLVAAARQAASSIEHHYRLTAMESLEKVIFSLQAKMTDETKVLQAVVDSVVFELGYAGAMVATLERGNALPVRAYALDDRPQILAHLEEKAGIKLISSKAVVYLDDDHYKDNLSVRAVKSVNGRPQKYLTSNKLYDLLRPVVRKSLADFAQQMLGIRAVIAVPFFVEDEVVGNLFVGSRRDHFSAWEISVLTSFGQQAAAGIRNARLYHEMEEQRRIAEMFSRMAFSANASVHALSNHLSAVRTYLHLLTAASSFPPTQQQEILNNSANMLERLRQTSDILENLHTPWQQMPDEPVSVNDCLVQALHEVFPQLLVGFEDGSMVDKTGVRVHMMLAPHLPRLMTSPDMLTEALRVIVKNGREAIAETGQKGDLWITTGRVALDEVEVIIRDNGAGIAPEDLPHIYDLGWTTKMDPGMGFGLFWARDYILGVNGRIEVESVWQEGTTFRLSLPAAV